MTFTIINGFAQSPDAGKRTPISKKYRTWSVGVSGGISTPYTLVGYNSRQDFTSPDVRWGYGFYIKDQLTHSIGLQGDFFSGNLRADHSHELFSNGNYINSQFDTKITWSASLSGSFIIAHIYGKHQEGIIQPYVNLGIGIMNYTAVLYPYRAAAIYSPAASTAYFPLGAGFKIKITSAVNLDIGYQVNFVNTDNLDGHISSATNDRFSYTHLGLEFVLGNRLKLHLASISKAAAIQKEYAARETALRNELQAQQADLDQQKKANDKLQNDLDAANASLARINKDSDGDGVPDYFDKCPNTPAGTKVDGVGCPVESQPAANANITDDDRKVAAEASRNLEFYSGTTVIVGFSFTSLNKLAKLLTDKNFSIKVDAYTDNLGDPNINLKFSQAKANAVKAYLVNKGVNASRVEAMGYGDTKPIASNKTVAGRKLNNRIEFTLF